MVYKIYWFFILTTAPVILSLKLQVDGKMDFGPKFNYEYRIKPLEMGTDNPSRTFTSIDGHKLVSNVNSTQPKYIDIIIKNNKANPRLVQVAEVRDNDEKRGKTTQNGVNMTNIVLGSKKEAKATKAKKNEPLKFSDEHTEPSKVKEKKEKPAKNGKYVQHLVRIAENVAPKSEEVEEIAESIESPEKSKGVTVLIPLNRKKNKKHVRNFKTDEIKSEDVKIENINLPKSLYIRQNTSNQITTEANKATSSEKTDKEKSIFIKSHLVKDDPKIREFTKHIYMQSLKTLESIKDKINSYEMRKEVDHLKRSYEERFGDFVRETQNQKIRTRLGGQKVILNTLDTSNRILDRLVNYMIGKMDKKGILRSPGTENVILNELTKKKDLENKHICSKMQICPTSDSFTKFSVDVLSTILSSPDNKIIEMRDALTEVLKNTDFSNFLDPSTEKRFLRGMGDVERYNADTMRPIFFMMKNILSSKNSPIKVIGPPDGRVNKTLAFLEMLDSWEKKLPPNEQNVLEWNDMRNSFKEWRVGKRRDTVDLIQHFTDHITKTIDDNNGRLFDKNVNTVLGF